ncbi:MAG: acyltransferase [Candidatus Roizmanbacteria bacterium]|nr:acyltransferase [Candidatus Roizmanbacteria bacterium]
MKQRLPEIDDIRGISIILMIMIHTNVYFLSNKISYMTLELSQFAVVAFIFCSAYLFYLKQQVYGWSEFFSHLVKRIKRLVIPYYWFFAVYYIFLLIKEPKKLTLSYLTQNIFVIGGLDFNWLVLLFIELAILMPFVSYLFEKKRAWFYIYTAAAFLSSLVFLKYTPLSYYRYIMWLPWSLVLIYTYLFNQLKEKKSLFWIITAFCFALYYILPPLILKPLGRSLFMYDNKYPPNLYHLAYGVGSVNLLYMLSQWKWFSNYIVQTIINFFSTYSYTIFFIHILVIYTVTVFFHFHFNWVTFFMAVTGITILVQLAYNGITHLLSTLKS